MGKFALDMPMGTMGEAEPVPNPMSSAADVGSAVSIGTTVNWPTDCPWGAIASALKGTVSGGGMSESDSYGAVLDKFFHASERAVTACRGLAKFLGPLKELLGACPGNRVCDKEGIRARFIEPPTPTFIDPPAIMAVVSKFSTERVPARVLDSSCDFELDSCDIELDAGKLTDAVVATGAVVDTVCGICGIGADVDTADGDGAARGAV
jgi:hypothetical protein